MTTTGNDLAVRNGTVPAYQQAALAIKPGQLTWDKYQEAALAQIGLKNASNADRAVFLHQCQRTGLDPFARQIYMIERREKVQGTNEWVSKWTIQTGIDGYRVNRARAERAAGVRGTLGRAVFYDWDGVEHKAWVRAEPPAACEITYTVRDPDGTQTPYTSVLRFDEYVQTRKETRDGTEQRVPSGQWATKPAHMLEKCTEADVYRKAFPQDFSGIHLDDAMPPAEDAPQPPQRATAEEIRNRPRRPQQARAEVVPPEDAPWPGDAAAAQAKPSGRSPGAAASFEPSREGDAGDPRDDVRAWFGRAGITSLETQMNYAGQLLDIAPPASLDSLARVQAGQLAALLAKCADKDSLDALLATGEVPDGQ